MTTEELERQVRKNTIAIKTVSDSLVNYVQNQQLTSTNKVTAANTSDIDKLKNDLNSIQTQINLQNRIELMKDTNIVDPTKLDLLQYDGDRWSNIAASKVVTGLLGRLTDLQDVEIKNLRNDNALAWDSELQKWTNKNLNTELYDDIYISKIKPDSTPYEVWFKDSAIFGQEGFASGLTGFGGKIDKFGHAEFDSLTLRRFLEVPELRYNRVEIQLGDKWNAPGAGVIESVEELDQYTGLITLKLEEGEYGAVSVGDLCMGIFHSERTQENAEQDEDDGKGNRKFAGFYTVYFEVTNILDSQNKKFGYRLRPVDEYWNMTFHPCAQMNFVAYGNKTNVDRQTSCYSTRTYTRYLVKQNTWDHKAKNIAMQFGDLSNLNIFGYEMTGYSAYLNSVYFTGTITQVKPNGDEVRVANDCGAWEPDTHYDYYDRVSVEGYLWLCINPNGADDKPSSSSPNWLEQVSKGDKGEVSYFHIKYSPVENPTASQMTETPDVYIGTYVDFNYADSNNPADYTWARFQGVQGEKGEQGIPGIGIDGKTYYLHIKYSNDGGRTFTGNNGEDPGDWLGLLTDLNVNDSTNPADYKWSKTKGEQGDQGIPGSNGSDGADGLIIRRSEWKPNREYRNDQDVPQSVSKIRYLDIVLVRDFGAATGYKVYKCIYTVAPHISSDSNAPGTSGGAAYWEEFTTNVESIYTDLIIAKDAKLDFVSGNAVRVGYESGTNNFTVVAGITGAGGNNGSAIRIWAGATEENRGNAPFRVTQDGRLYANNAYISGTINATEGMIGSFNIYDLYIQASKDSESLRLANTGIEFDSSVGNFDVKLGSTSDDNYVTYIDSNNSNRIPLVVAKSYQQAGYNNIAIKAYGNILAAGGSVQGTQVFDVSLRTANTIFRPFDDVQFLPRYVHICKGYYTNNPMTSSASWTDNYEAGLAVPNNRAIQNATGSGLVDISGGSKGIVMTYINPSNNATWLVARGGTFHGVTLSSDYPYLYDWGGNAITGVKMDKGAVVQVLYTRISTQYDSRYPTAVVPEYRGILLFSQYS